MYSLSNEAEMSVKSIFDSFRSNLILPLFSVIFESKYSPHSSGVQSFTEYESKGFRVNNLQQESLLDYQKKKSLLDSGTISNDG